ncbi:MAG: hypothetical protein MI919_28600 [Holophagales bacterium]|nr:hypothetical protein [Holophagales bacterium]
MRFTEWLMIAVGILLGAFGFLILVGGLLGAEEEGAAMGHMAGVVALGILPLACGTLLVRRALHAAARRRKEAMERSILELAAASGGRLSAVDVARATPLTLDEAKTTLDTLHLAGHCRTELGDDGSLTFSFEP